ncbi:MAG: alpha/beta fold hydrolase [Alphaproteobacteria bacterium]|nr:alpha/beta fold hydrolase [Alphaproteobacteria bacterium]
MRTITKTATAVWAALWLWTMPATAAIQELQIDGDHGKLSAVLQTPDNIASYPLVILMHGFTANKNSPLLRQIAENLQQVGIASLSFDFNGHGQSEGKFQDMTIPNEINDARKVYEYVRLLSAVTSVSLLGHSQGGVVAGMLAGELGTDKIKSLVLLAPAAVLRDNMANGEMFGVKFTTFFLPPYIEIFGGYKVGRNYLKTARDLPIYETSAKYQGPVLIVHGTADNLVPYTYSERYHEIYHQSELRLLENFDHGFSANLAQTAGIVTDFLFNRLTP